MSAARQHRGSWASRAAVSLLVLAFSAAARADPSTDARALFQAGVVHARARAWTYALRAFESAYELAPKPAVLFNLASAQLRTGRLLAAASNYTRFLHLQDASIAAVHRAAAQDQLAWIEAHVPRLRISVIGMTGEDRLTIDGQRIYPNESEHEHWLDPGAHEVRLIRPNGQEESHRIVLAESEHRVLPLTLP